MKITPDLTPERFARLVDGGEPPTLCLVCTDDTGHRVTIECDNPACEDGLIWPDEDDEPTVPFVQLPARLVSQ